MALIGACLVLSLWSGRASAQINCDIGGSVQLAINSGADFIDFTGTCNETLSIDRNGVHIFGASADPALDVINGGINVFGAQNVTIENLTVNGTGFFIMDGSFVTVRGSVIENTNFGFGVLRHSGAWLIANTFGPALIDDVATSCLPICVGAGSFARLRNNTVTGATDTGAALDVYRNSSVRMRGGNTITNSGTGWALLANQDSFVRQDDSGGNGSDQITGKVNLFLNSVLDTRQAVITGEVSVRQDSILRTGSSSGGDPSLMVIDGGIALSQDSALRVDSPLVTINGDVTCADGESSAQGSFAGTGRNLCSGFSSVANDFNGDGKADLLWRNGATGATILWLMDGSTQLAGQTIGKVPLAWTIEKVEDFNGDGKADIMWRNGATGGNILWLMDGFSVTPQPVIPVPIAWELQP